MRRPADEKGQALVEMALVLVMLVLMAVGAANTGWVIRQYVQVVNAANNAVNYASKGQPWAENQFGVQDAADSEALDTVCVDPPGLQASIPVIGADSVGAPNVSVTVTCVVTTPVAMPPFPENFTIQVSASRRMYTWAQ